jgi:4-alpha-glucanotransferase
MNVPGQEAGNWCWRYQTRDLTPRLQQRLRALTELYAR